MYVFDSMRFCASVDTRVFACVHVRACGRVTCTGDTVEAISSHVISWVAGPSTEPAVSGEVTLSNHATNWELIFK